jgi:hypothetical protein
MLKDRIIYWSPRLLTIFAIGFISVFALDAFDPKLSLTQQILGFLLHMVPSFLLIAILLYAWKHEKTGGLILILLGICFTPVIFIKNYQHNGNMAISLSIIALVCLPFIIAGVLFLYSHWWHNRQKNDKLF